MTSTNEGNNSKLPTNYYSFSRLLKFLTNSYWDTMEDLNAPKDHYKLAYVIFYWLGTGSLLPWNFFITGKDTYYCQVGYGAKMGGGSKLDRFYQ